MEISKLQGFVMLMVLVGMILGVGILVFNNFERATWTTTAVTDETVVVGAGGAGATANAQVLTMVRFENASGTPNCTTFNQPLACVNWTEAGVISTNASYFSETCNATYTYGANSSTSDVMAANAAAAAPIASTWMPLIITVGALAIILSLVVLSFVRRAR